uniref:Uncharacterized protein n=1 Tax=Panagrolaimus sp. ES5 TaxID=591445 RepID=A0AC34FQY6_9BILA
MEQSNLAIQGMKDNQVTVAAMKDGRKTMKNEYKKLNIDKIGRLHDEMEYIGYVNKCDELQLDGDSTFLDEALTTPGVPAGIPGQPHTNHASDIGVDEFGLPLVLAKLEDIIQRIAALFSSD